MNDEEAKRLVMEMVRRARTRCPPIPPRLHAALMSTCSHHFDAVPALPPHRWHMVAMRLGLRNAGPGAQSLWGDQ